MEEALLCRPRMCPPRSVENICWLICDLYTSFKARIRLSDSSPVANRKKIKTTLTNPSVSKVRIGEIYIH